MNRQETFVDTALKQNGAPYVWRGKGNLLLSPSGLLVINPFADHYPSIFDCSGLVTYAAFEAGMPDYRASWWAQSMYTDLKPCRREDFAALWFFGETPEKVSHVAIHCGANLLVQANGGDHTTTTPDLAWLRSAMVRTRMNTREKDYLGARTLAW